MRWPSRLFVLLLAVGMLWAGVGLAEEQNDVEVHWGTDRLVEYRVGELPIILVIPHDGSRSPGDIPNRTRGIRGADRHAMAYGLRVYELLHERTGRRPHLVICHLHRRKVDVNRDVDEAAQGSEAAERTWSEFHGFIEQAKEKVAEAHEHGHLFDLHTMGRSAAVEIGHLLTRARLNADDDELNTDANRRRTSLRALVERSPLDLADLVRGPKSIGALLEERDIPTIPSPERPAPTGAFYSGGYITQRHGSHRGGTVDATQVEGNRTRLNNAEYREKFSQALAESILEFMKEHYDLEVQVDAEARGNVLPEPQQLVCLLVLTAVIEGRRHRGKFRRQE